MSIEQVEREIADACDRLAASAAVLRYCHEHYLDQLTAAHLDGSREAERQFAQRRDDVRASYRTEMAMAEAARGRAAGQLAETVATVTATHPWAVADFTAPVWDDYQPDMHASPPAWLRVGTIALGQAAAKPGSTAGLPAIPAVARFTGHGHLLINENEFADQARSLLQALALRLAAASTPGTVRFALADPVGHGKYLSAFLRLPAELRLGAGVATTVADIEAMLAALAGHAVDVTQTRLTNVYESVEAYNQASAGTAVPYHMLVIAGFPSGISDRAAETLTRLAHVGPRAGVYVVATLDAGQELPRGFDLAGLTTLGTNLRFASPVSLTWDDPDLGAATVEPDQMPAAAQVNPWLDAVAAAAATRSRDLPFERIAIAPAQRWAD